jgi:fluoride exporter
MSLMSILMIALGGALGAVARFASASLIQPLFGARFPVGTLFVNGLGSFVIGCVMSVLIGRVSFGAESLRLFMVVGFIGAYTTFSSFAWETVSLFDGGQWGSALMNVLLNNVITILMVMIGIRVGRLIGGA